jgi:hypothetical protein
MAALAIPLNPDDTAGKPPLSPRRLPRSLRLCVATLLILSIGSLLSVGLPAYREQQMIRRIEGWDGVVDTETVGPEWLRKLVGQDQLKRFKVFERIRFVDLVFAEHTDRDLAELSGLKNLRWLILNNREITNAGMRHLSGLTNLEVLHLRGTAVGDEGLVHLSPLAKLRFLVLEGTAVTDAGMAHVSGLPKLEFLLLSRTSVTDAGLPHLSGLKNLKLLDLRTTFVTSQGIEKLQKALPRCNIIQGTTGHPSFGPRQGLCLALNGCVDL